MSDSISASSSNSSRASMIAEPCSPIGPDTMIRSPGRSPAVDIWARGSTHPHAGRADVHLVGVAALHDLGVAGHDLHAGRLGGAGGRLDLGAQLIGGEALLEHERQAQRQRPRARHGQVVDGAVHRQLPDRAAREADRPDHEAVGGHAPAAPRRPSRRRRHRAARAPRCRRRAEEALDQRLAGLAAGAVRHRDALVLELRLLAASGLDDPEDPLLPRTPGGAGSLTRPPARCA